MGGGKTFSLLLDWMRHINTPGANGLIVRNRHKDIVIAGGVWEEAKKIYKGTGAHFRGPPYLDVEWPSGAKLAFKHVEESTYTRLKGPGFSWIGVEEADEIAMHVITWLLSRNRTTCGAIPRMRWTCNPAPYHPLRDWVDAYLTPEGVPDRSKAGKVLYVLRHHETDKFVFGRTRAEAEALSGQDGSLAQSFAFYPSLLADNPALASTGYARKFATMTKVEREKNSDGNWNSKEATGGMLRRTRWGQTILTAPLAPIVTRIRGWDRAGTSPHAGTPNPDFTAGPILYWDIKGRLYVAGLEACREEPPEVDRLMATTAADDGPGVIQAIEKDPAQAGKAENSHTLMLLRRAVPGGEVRTVPAINNKVVKAQPLANELERGMPRANEDEEPWEPMAYILDETGWTSEPYLDAGDAPSTKIALFWSMVDRFFDPRASVKKDIVDAMTTAHTAKNATGAPVIDIAKRAMRWIW